MTSWIELQFLHPAGLLFNCLFQQRTIIKKLIDLMLFVLLEAV